MDATVPPTIVETRTAETDAPVHADEPGAHAIDVGVGTFLRSGIAASGVIGVTPYITDPISEDVFLRIAAMVGTAPASDLRMTWAAGRLDTCGSIIGNYARGSGLRLDLCGGADAGATFIASSNGGNPPNEMQTLPYVDLGPSVDMRADLGNRAALSIRVALGFNIARDSFIDTTGEAVTPPIQTLQVELDLSWLLPGGHSSARVASAKTPAKAGL